MSGEKARTEKKQAKLFGVSSEVNSGQCGGGQGLLHLDKSDLDSAKTDYWCMEHSFKKGEYDFKIGLLCAVFPLR